MCNSYDQLLVLSYGNNAVVVVKWLHMLIYIYNFLAQTIFRVNSNAVFF